jgi:hypothetical protein
MTNREMKSKVMALGNRLAPRMGGDRTAAFCKAWELVCAGTLELAVKGVMQGSRQEALRRLAKYESSQIRAFLLPEPGNQYDKNAIAVMCGVNGGKAFYKLGYVPRNLTQVVTAIGARLPALRVVSGSWGFCGVTHGARLALAV